MRPTFRKVYRDPKPAERQSPSIRELVRNHDGFFSNYFARALGLNPPPYHWITDAEMDLAAEIRSDLL